MGEKSPENSYIMIQIHYLSQSPQKARNYLQELLRVVILQHSCTGSSHDRIQIPPLNLREFTHSARRDRDNSEITFC